MSRVDPLDTEQSDVAIKEVDGPLSRWQRRKQAVLEEQHELQQQLRDKEKAAPALTDDDMPPVESLTIDSDFSGFLSPDVSEDLRRLALRKLFQCSEFNICDGLDDYDGDYTSFAKLGNIITADMKHQIEVEAKRQMEELAEVDKPGPLNESDVQTAAVDSVDDTDETTNEANDPELVDADNNHGDMDMNDEAQVAEFDEMNINGDEVT